ncbi:MAG: transposase [Cyanobacteria bacterium QS_8_64_29]|nr:MAG: transposase [Cyanobacteria bacterium QS_8_64_29]
MATRRVTFRLYPRKSTERKLHYARKAHCELYNAALSHRKTQYKRLGVSIGYLDQQNSLPEFKAALPEYAQFGSHTLQATLKRVDFAFQRFFKGLARYPKFKPKRTYRGWAYPDAAGWQARTDGKHGHLELRDLGLNIRMRGQARTWGKPTTCTIFWNGRNWYASITVRCAPTRETGRGSVGLDFGCKTAIVPSQGEPIEAPQFQAEVEEKRLYRGLRRKRRPNKRQGIQASRRWKKQQARIRKVRRKVARQRHDWSHQVAAQIVRRNSLVATERLNVQGMTRKGKGKGKRPKARLNRSMLDVGIGMTRDRIRYKVEEAGGVYLEASTQQLKPTQRCASCWELTPKALDERTHCCQSCGHLEGRDRNAAQVMLAWARGAGRASSDAELPSATPCGSMAQLGAKKRRKPLAQRSG